MTSASASPTSAPPPSTSPRPGDDDWKPNYSLLGGSEKKATPKWVPVSMLALTACALAVPIALLRRANKSIPQEPLRAATVVPPPRRTAGRLGGITSAPSPKPSSSVPPPRRVAVPQPSPPPPVRFPASARAAPALPTPAPIPKTAPSDAAHDVNIPLYWLKAFGISTTLVAGGAMAAVWGTMYLLGVNNTEEFARRMRYELATRMPVLSSRIHRVIGGEDSPMVVGSDAVAHLKQAELGDAEWNWPDAELRLKDAYERDGISGWAQAALLEAEAEGQLERVRRGHA